MQALAASCACYKFSCHTPTLLYAPPREPAGCPPAIELLLAHVADPSLLLTLVSSSTASVPGASVGRSLLTTAPEVSGALPGSTTVVSGEPPAQPATCAGADVWQDSVHAGQCTRRAVNMVCAAKYFPGHLRLLPPCHGVLRGWLQATSM